MILFRILTKSKGVGTCACFLATEQKPCIFHDKPRHRQFRRQITLQCILICKMLWNICWQDGRRIVELKTLAEQLNACDGCDTPLN
jgi:hypothetical protein